MDEARLRELIDDLRAGRTDPDTAVAQLRRLPFADVGVALVDHHRALRQGLPETVYAPGKTPEQCVRIVTELLDHDDLPVLVTRTGDAQAEALEHAHPGAHAQGGALAWRVPLARRISKVAIVAAGTSDLPVVDECDLTLRCAGFDPIRLVDVGVAGLHRLLASIDIVTNADAVIVVAGMEGALASVVGGLTGAPVVAVPTSAGYGSALDGVTALLAMHASCASGVTVVGIDNGFGAACAVARMCR
jgi:pyridinium-3,5-biscarboxylic acid mononucleotide synthase